MHGTGRPAEAAEAPLSLEVPPAVVQLLGLPDPVPYAEDQRRGALCVWCTQVLTLATAVDLGELDSSIGRWFPRSCPACVSDRAHRALNAHTDCDDCHTGDCATVRALYRLQRDGRK
ncbi:hypothetical protein [Streptomyces flaveolus]|uniref:hypothetical protein n=1 Tax=Streptomyces flaveolus TaxID=67297 RepID=UPI003703242B